MQIEILKLGEGYCLRFFWDTLYFIENVSKLFICHFANYFVKTFLKIKCAIFCIYSCAQKSESSYFFVQFFASIFFRSYFFYKSVLFHYSPNSTCAKMQHALHYQLVLHMFIFFFQQCFNFARHGLEVF